MGAASELHWPGWRGATLMVRVPRRPLYLGSALRPIWVMVTVPLASGPGVIDTLSPPLRPGGPSRLKVKGEYNSYGQLRSLVTVELASSPQIQLDDGSVFTRIITSAVGLVVGAT